MARVTAPNRHYTGRGPGGAEFSQGVADNVTDAGALAYYRRAGYTVDGGDTAPATGQAQAPGRDAGDGGPAGNTRADRGDDDEHEETTKARKGRKATGSSSS